MNIDFEQQIKQLQEYKEILYFISSMDISPSMRLMLYDDITVYKPLVRAVVDIINSYDLVDLEAFFQYMCMCNPAIPHIATKEFSIKKEYGESYFLSVKPDDVKLIGTIEWDPSVYAELLIVFFLEDDCEQLREKWNLEDVLLKEQIIEPHNEYKLVELNDYDFGSRTIFFNNKAYLYNHLLVKDKINGGDKCPGFAKVLYDNRENGVLRFRLDNRLSMPISEHLLMTECEHAEYFGPKFNFDKITKFKYKPVKIVRCNPDTSDKLLMIIKSKRNQSTGEEFYDIMVETLPAPEKNDWVITTFVHGEYHENTNDFRHIDLANNQYGIDDYKQKFYHNEFDKYTISRKFHYKQWCIEGGTYSRNTWIMLVKMSLENEYRNLFDELFE